MLGRLIKKIMKKSFFLIEFNLFIASVISFFVPLYLYKITQSLHIATIFFVASLATKLFLGQLVSAYGEIKGLRTLKRLSLTFLVIILGVFLLFSLGWHPLILISTAILVPMCVACLFAESELALSIQADKEKKNIIGFQSLLSSCSSVISPLVGGVIMVSNIGVEILTIATVIAITINACCVVVFDLYSVHDEQEKQIDLAKVIKAIVSGNKEIINNRFLLHLNMFTALSNLIFGFSFSYVGVYLISLNYTEDLVGLVMSFSGVFAIVASWFYSRKNNLFESTIQFEAKITILIGLATMAMFISNGNIYFFSIFFGVVTSFSVFANLVNRATWHKNVKKDKVAVVFSAKRAFSSLGGFVGVSLTPLIVLALETKIVEKSGAINTTFFIASVMFVAISFYFLRKKTSA